MMNSKRKAPGPIQIPTSDSSNQLDANNGENSCAPPQQTGAELDDSQMDAKQRERLEKFLQKKNLVTSMNPEDFQKLEDLGSGVSGCVEKVLHKPTGLIMARKLIHLEVKLSVRNSIMNELRVLHECNSPNIVGFYGAFPAEGEISICMEFMDGGSLDKVYHRVGRVDEKYLSKITAAVLKGLAYLKEKHRIVHRDIKPSNILVNSKGEIKLCDFGVSGHLVDSMANSFVGSRSYMSPERLQGTHYSISSDIWSLGLTLIELAVGRYPIPLSESDERQLMESNNPQEVNHEAYESITVFDLLEYIVNQPPPTISVAFFSPEFKSFVDACLKKDKGERPDLKTLMQHPFVTRADSIADADMAEWVKRTIEVAETTPPRGSSSSSFHQNLSSSSAAAKVASTTIESGSNAQRPIPRKDVVSS